MAERLLSGAQAKALRLALEGDLIRWPGGFWSRRGEPAEDKGQGIGFVPTRHVGVATIRNLTRRGYLERADLESEWRDPRHITPVGREAINALS